MALRTSVYVSKTMNLTDARYCAGMGVDYLGFNFDEKEGEVVSEANFFAITSWLAGVKVVAECGALPMDQVEIIASRFQPQTISTSRLDVLENLNKTSFETFLVWNFEELSDELFTVLSELDSTLFGLIVVSNSDQAEVQFSEDQISQLSYYASQFKLILGFGAQTDNVTDLLDAIQPAGIMLKGKEEIKPGISELDELADMLEQLEIEDY